MGTKITKGNVKSAIKDDKAHIDYLKRDVLWDDKHGHSDIDMTADEKHISKLAGDLKYDKKHHSPLHHTTSTEHEHQTCHEPGSGRLHKCGTGSKNEIKGRPEQYKKTE